MGGFRESRRKLCTTKRMHIFALTVVTFLLKKEVIGNQIDYNIAYEIIRQELTSIEENQVIDLTSIMQLPQVMSNDKNLVEKM